MHPTVPPPRTPDFTQSSRYARDTSRFLGTTVPYPCKRRFPVRFHVLTGLTHATLRADCGSCVLARLMHATGLCATGGCRIQASTRDRLVHKSGLCTRHYGNGEKTTCRQNKDTAFGSQKCFSAQFISVKTLLSGVFV